MALRLCLFPMLERLGDRHAALSSAAELTLCRLCAALRAPACGSLPALLAANADFLLDALGRRLKRADAYPHTSHAVQAVLEFGGERALPLAKDILDDVLALVDDAAPQVSTRQHPSLAAALSNTPC